MSKFIAVVLLRAESCQASDGISKEMATRLACKRQSKPSWTSWWFLVLKTINRATHLCHLSVFQFGNGRLANWSRSRGGHGTHLQSPCRRPRTCEDLEDVPWLLCLATEIFGQQIKMNATEMWREVLICPAARCPQAGCANPKGHLLWENEEMKRKN